MSIKLFIGPMLSGKSVSMICELERHILARRSCIIVRHSTDTRYGDTEGIKTNDGLLRAISIPILRAESLAAVADEIARYQVVGVSEVQFFPDALLLDEWANRGQIVFAEGLDGDFMRRPFGQMGALIPLCEEVVKLRGVCSCGKDSSFSHRTSGEASIVVIGGADKYKPLCRGCYRAATTGELPVLKLNAEANISYSTMNFETLAADKTQPCEHGNVFSPGSFPDSMSLSKGQNLLLTADAIAALNGTKLIVKLSMDGRIMIERLGARHARNEHSPDRIPAADTRQLYADGSLCVQQKNRAPSTSVHNKPRSVRNTDGGNEFPKRRARGGVKARQQKYEKTSQTGARYAEQNFSPRARPVGKFNKVNTNRLADIVDKVAETPAVKKPSVSADSLVLAVVDGAEWGADETPVAGTSSDSSTANTVGDSSAANTVGDNAAQVPTEDAPAESPTEDTVAK